MNPGNINDEVNGQGVPLFEVTTRTPEQTRILAGLFGNLLHGKTVIGLNGELGAGKTEFVKGFAIGSGVPDGTYITSPTYSIINHYAARIALYHLDLYRLSGPEDLYDTGLEDILSENAVFVVEWPAIMNGLSGFDIQINIQVLGITERKISFFAYGLANSNLIRELANQYKEKITTWD